MQRVRKTSISSTTSAFADKEPLREDGMRPVGGGCMPCAGVRGKEESPVVSGAYKTRARFHRYGYAFIGTSPLRHPT